MYIIFEKVKIQRYDLL